MCWQVAIPAVAGLMGTLLAGGGKGQPMEMTSTAPQWMTGLGKGLSGYLQGKIGQPATPYGGPLYAQMSPLSGMGANIISQMYGGTPYQTPPYGTFNIPTSNIPMGMFGGGFNGGLGGGGFNGGPGGFRGGGMRMPFKGGFNGGFNGGFSGMGGGYDPYSPFML